MVKHLFRLMVKDVHAFGIMIAVMGFFSLLMAGFFTVVENSSPWQPYISIGSVQIMAISCAYIFFSYRSGEEKLLVSLPIARSTIVISKYVSALLISIVFSLIWYLNARFIAHLFEIDKSAFGLFFNPAVWIILLTAYILVISLFIPMFSGIPHKWLQVIIFTPVAYIYVKSMEWFVNSKHGLDGGVSGEGMAVLGGMVLFAAAVLYVSVRVMVRYLHTVDL